MIAGASRDEAGTTPEARRSRRTPVCEDHSVIRADRQRIWVGLTNRECAQPIHLLRHAWETGVPFAQLAAQDRIIVAMLGDIYRELVAFTRARGVRARPARAAPMA
jgi:hypothetical protein